MRVLSLLFILVSAVTVLADADVSKLEGTWTSKSNAVFTGPDFYDPVDELLIEPALPGISYSFTKDNYFEEAQYRISPNAKQPDCPSAILIYQHGKYEIKGDKLVLHPFKVDGRQLVSDPCNETTSQYLRYNQTETFKKFDVVVDDYHGRYRLDLYQFDGSPSPPLYLAYRPPMMLPTETMNPTGGPKETSVSNKVKRTSEKIKRTLENRGRTNAVHHGNWDYNVIWWTGVSLIFIGATGWCLL